VRSATPQEIVFVAGRRTPFGTYGGTLKDHSATDLAVLAAKAALADVALPPDAIGHVIVGNVLQTSADAIYLARHVGLRAGVPVETPALVVNRLCGSGFEAVVQGALQIATGQAEAVLVGGTESMSQAPYVVRGGRFGVPLGKTPALEDALWSALTDTQAGMPMALTAEKLAEQYRITQDEVDEFSVLSQRRTAEALQFVQRLANDGTDYSQFIRDLLRHLRQLFLLQHLEEAASDEATLRTLGQTVELDGELFREQLQRAGQVSPREVVFFIESLGQAQREIRDGLDPRLQLELALVKMTRPELDHT
jgi:hypothetical protein